MYAKKCICWLVLTGCAFTGFGQSYTRFSGICTGIDKGTKAYLYPSGKGGRIDSMAVNDSTFAFTPPIDQSNLYFLQVTARSRRLNYGIFLQPGSVVHIHIKEKNGHVAFSGSDIANDQNNFYAGLFKIADQETRLINQLDKEKDSTQRKQLQWQQKKLSTLRQHYMETWIRNNKNSGFALAVLFLFMQDQPVAVWKELYAVITPDAKKNNLVNETITYFLTTKTEDEKLKTGERIPDFVLQDTAGKSHSFYALHEKKYVMLDFWASWCMPCRESVPEIKQLIKEYEKYGFKVISISADTDADKWKKAIVEDGVYWMQLSDLRGTENGFIREKGIYAFPGYVLISPEGIVLYKPFRIARMRELLDEYIKGIQPRDH